MDAIIEVLIDSLVESLGSTNEALMWVLGPNKMPEVLVSLYVYVSTWKHEWVGVDCGYTFIIVALVENSSGSPTTK